MAHPPQALLVATQRTSHVNHARMKNKYPRSPCSSERHLTLYSYKYLNPNATVKRMYYPVILALTLIRTSSSLSLPSLPSLISISSNASTLVVQQPTSPNSDEWPAPPFLFRFRQDHPTIIAFEQYGNQVHPAQAAAVMLGLDHIKRTISSQGSPASPFWPRTFGFGIVRLVFNQSTRPQPQPYITIEEAVDVVAALSYLTGMYGPANIVRAEIFSGKILDMWLSLRIS